MFATIMDGEVDFADVMFLLGLILGVIAAVLSVASAPAARYTSTAGWLAVAAIAFGLMAL